MLKNKRQKKSKSDLSKSIKSMQRSTRSENKRNNKLLKLGKKEDVFSISSRQTGPRTRSMKNQVINMVKKNKTTANKVELIKKLYTTPKPCG